MSPARIALGLSIAIAIAAPASARHRHAPRAATPKSPLRSGAYVCQGEGAGMFPMTILPGFGYHAAGPPGHYVVAGGALHFTGGSLANNVGTLTDATSFALATIGSPQPYTRCVRAAAKPLG